MLGRDVAGRRFGNLVVVNESDQSVYRSGQRHRRVFCKCDCGGEIVTRLSDLASGRTKSCGCIRRAMTRRRGLDSKTHGLSQSGDSYNRWDSIKQRCFNPLSKDFKNYGQRGISMHGPWVSNFPRFFGYIKSLGERPKGYSLDRINNDGGYEPGNLRWASASTQRRNQRLRGVTSAA